MHVFQYFEHYFRNLEQNLQKFNLKEFAHKKLSIIPYMKRIEWVFEKKTRLKISQIGII